MLGDATTHSLKKKNERIGDVERERRGKVSWDEYINGPLGTRRALVADLLPDGWDGGGDDEWGADGPRWWVFLAE